ncbi:hypothetical protein LJR231_002714 [Phyllobacterium sp. LjRoot231]|uniref:hypothetical protein n=1 Tax=Phyllobacterium sp. LjRoot231 TaxID=3342289 RepID=UPI003ECC69A6
MSLLPVNESEHLSSIRASASRSSRYPNGTIRCIGAAMFRTLDAHAYGCLLDLDTDVSSWSCLPFIVVNDGERHAPDFVVTRADGDFLVDVVVAENPQLPSWLAGAAARRGYSHFAVFKADLIAKSVRIANAKDLLRYARWTTPLGDRLRLLTTLDEHGSLTVAECLTAFREIPAMAGLASMVLHRFLEVDLDDELLGPDTLVRRHRA